MSDTPLLYDLEKHADELEATIADLTERRAKDAREMLRLRCALRECETEAGAYCLRMGGKVVDLVRRLHEINVTVLQALADPLEQKE